VDQQIYIFGTRAAVKNGDEDGNVGGYLFIYLFIQRKKEPGLLCLMMPLIE
jgi:hypothetical protein